MTTDQYKFKQLIVHTQTYCLFFTSSGKLQILISPPSIYSTRLIIFENCFFEVYG